MATVKRLKNYDDKLIQYEPKPHPGPPTSNNEDTSWGDKRMRTKILGPGPQEASKSKGTSRSTTKDNWRTLRTNVNQGWTPTPRLGDKFKTWRTKVAN